tara:strand:+ start:393 stop:941 length:549 start_codon:yes stop_codon:yes gene_type:complete
MKKIFLTFFFMLLTSNLSASIKNNIIEKFINVENLTFNFEQNINGKIEKGNCTLEYPKKIYCRYDLKNQKILVSNGKSLVIKTLTSFYLYPLEKTPLNSILDKNLLLKKVRDLEERDIGDNYINFKFKENENEINLFFDKRTFNLIGWQTIDIYQNISITYLSSIKRNRKLDKKLFLLPKQN